ncbi:MAG: metalloregulator ArsR/SmtB family transcription factor [Parvibaculum sp.]
MTNQMHVKLDRLFHALGDPTRRAVVQRLGRGPAAVGELARPFKMALPSFMQHLAVLEKCDLVTSCKEGRRRIYKLEPQTLKTLETWLSQQRLLWETRLDQLDDYLVDMKEEER